MSKYSPEEIDNFLKIIDPLLHKQPEEVVQRFKENLKNPKDDRAIDQAKMLLSLAESSIKFNKMAVADGKIIEDERDILAQYPKALTSAMKSMLIDARKQLENEKKKENKKEKDQPQPTKKSFWRKVVDFIKDPKALLAASIMVPTGSLGETGDKSDEAKKQSLEIHYSPQTFNEAIQDVTEIVMKQKNEAKGKISTVSGQQAPTKPFDARER